MSTYVREGLSLASKPQADMSGVWIQIGEGEFGGFAPVEAAGNAVGSDGSESQSPA
jgi:hypothetical protein